MTFHDIAQWLEAAGDRLLRLEPRPSFLDRTNDAHRIYMDRPWRGRVLDWACMRIRRCWNRDYGIRGFVRQVGERISLWRAWRRLSRARELRFCSSYIQGVPCHEVEGYFDLDSDLSVGITIWSAGHVAQIAKQETSMDSLLNLGDYTQLEPVLVAPAPELTEAVIKTILERWYAERFRWKRGHWTWLEKRQPQIVIDLVWSDDGEILPPGIQRIR